MVQGVSWNQLKVLKQIKDDEYKIDEEELNEYAEYIGLNLPDDNDLLYIAIEGLTINLPSQWQACHTPDGQLVYRNLITRTIQEQHPLDQYYRNKVQQAKSLKRGEMPIIPQQPYGQSEMFEKNQSNNNRQQLSIPGLFDRNITQISDLQDKSIHQSSLKPSNSDLNPLKRNFLNQQLSLEQQIPLPKLKKLSQTHSAQYHIFRQPQKVAQKKHKLDSKHKEVQKKMKKMKLQGMQKEIILKQQLLKEMQEANHQKQKRLIKILAKKKPQFRFTNHQQQLKQFL